MAGEYLKFSELELTELKDADLSILRSGTSRIKEELAHLLKECPTMCVEDVCGFFRYVAGKCICINAAFENMVFDDQFSRDVADMLVNLRILNVGAGEKDIEENVRGRVESIVGYFFIAVGNAIDLLHSKEEVVELSEDMDLDASICEICNRIKKGIDDSGDFYLLEDFLDDGEDDE